MLPSRHIIISLPLGATVGLFTQSVPAGLLCFFSGILIDVDHAIDYVIHYGLKNFDYKEIYRACKNMAKSEEEGGVKKLYFLLHAIEFAILLWIGYLFSRNLYLLSIAIGYTGHLIIDVAGNGKITKPIAYSIAFRIANGFDRIKLIRQH